MPPALADSVIVFTDPRHSNGASTAPAVITRVWTDRMASVRISHDGSCHPGCTDRATVLMHASRAEAEAQPRTAGLLPSGGWPVPVPA